jgi:hypothetical protein
MSAGAAEMNSDDPASALQKWFCPTKPRHGDEPGFVVLLQKDGLREAKINDEIYKEYEAVRLNDFRPTASKPVFRHPLNDREVRSTIDDLKCDMGKTGYRKTMSGAVPHFADMGSF